MNPTRVVAGFVLAIQTAAVGAIAGTPPSELRNRTYAVRNLDPADAASLLCLRDPDVCKGCSLSSNASKEPSTAGMRGTISMGCNTQLMAEAWEQWEQKLAAALAAIDVRPPSQAFHVVVLAASRKEGPTPELPPSEARALADFKKVMTYRSFQLEAESVVRTDRGAEVQMNDAYDLSIVLDTSPSGDGPIHVRGFRLDSTRAVPTGAGGMSHPTYLDTSFAIKKGETIVLGGSTSDQSARVVLVTALP